MRPRILLLVAAAALPLPGCLQGEGAPQEATPSERWLPPVPGSVAVRWQDPPQVGGGVDVKVQDDDGRLDATVTNGSPVPVRYQGSSCSLHLARAQEGGWQVFASAPGNRHEALQTLEPGGSCRASLRLQDVATEAPLPAGTYRLVFLANPADADATVLAFAQVQVPDG